MTNDFKPAWLYLANGVVLDGQVPQWVADDYAGEVVFNTGMTGYEETLTDPSYAGQILTFTYPILGNYGVSSGARWESKRIHAAGVICETLYDEPHHYSAQTTFLKWLQDNNTPVMIGIDSRELTKMIREHGVVSGVITTKRDAVVEFSDSMSENQVAKVSPSEISRIGNGRYKVIVVDCGAKENIIRCLLKFDVTLLRVPFDYDYSAEQFDGVMLSNGPGDPKLCTKTIEVLQKVLSKNKPVFGICLGSQLMGLAIGANTYKLKFGHRGHNQPCIDLAKDRCFLTSQNHSYAVDETTLPEGWEVTFRHLNDNTVAGIRHSTLPFSAVQFHPEASSGPQDTFYLFEEFYAQIVKGANN